MTERARVPAGPWITGLLLGGLALAAAWLNLAAGGGLAALWSAVSGPAEGLQAVELRHAWLPRVAVSLLAGAGLAAAGTVMQQVLRNPIASPMTLGVAAGAQLALAVATLLTPEIGALAGEAVALAGGAAALALVVGLAWHRRLEPVTVVLAGLVVSLYCHGVYSALQLFYANDLQALLLWGGGALAQHDWSNVTFLAPRVAAALAALVLLTRPLTVMTLDDASAQALGLTLQRMRLLALAVAVYLAATVVSAVGVIGFVGLAAPAMAGLLGARTFARRLLWAPLLGAGLLLATDQLVQQLDPLTTGLLPTGAVTALLGAPLLIWLLRQVRPGAPASHGLPAQRSAHSNARRFAMLGLGLAMGLAVALLVSRDAAGWRLHDPLAVFSELFWRPPRVAAAALAGILLALAGTVLQRLLRNPMASPEVLGISGGALVGVVALMYVVPEAGHAGLVSAGSAGAAVTAAALMVFARYSSHAPERVLLAGIAAKALFDGLFGIVGATGAPFWLTLLGWVAGSTYGMDWTTVAWAAAVTVVAFPAALLLGRWLELLALGAEQAAARGLDVGRAQVVLLALAAVTTTMATLLVGPLSFTGLMAPHLARMLGFHHARTQLAGACAVGALLLVVADWAGRNLLVPFEVPAGIAASLIGGLYFMWLLRRL